MLSQNNLVSSRKFNLVLAGTGLCLVFALNAVLVTAQKGTVVRKNVVFAKGTSSTVIKGSATWGTAYIYKLQAKLGQRMTITLAGKPDFDFSLVTAGEQPSSETVGVKSWSGSLNESGVYQTMFRT